MKEEGVIELIDNSKFSEMETISVEVESEAFVVVELRIGEGGRHKVGNISWRTTRCLGVVIDH